MSEWGGPWTETKLSIVREYVSAYLRALKNQPFNKIYVDAFAGKGHRILERSPFYGIFNEEKKPIVAGSPELILRECSRADRPFEQFIFVELNESKYRELHKIKTIFTQFSDCIDIKKGDANDCLLTLCKTGKWNNTRALVFLDPYGMQIKWTTLSALAQTQAVDLWFLFPLGVAIMRLLKTKGTISDKVKERLSTLFGTDEWFWRFYKSLPIATLFGDEENGTIRAAGFKQVSDFFIERLTTIFPKGGIISPFPLYNSKNIPIYMLCFACGNPRGVPLARKIAKAVLKSHS